MEKVRAFIAVNIGDEARSVLSALQNQLIESGADVRWVAPKNMHLTLAFLGNVKTATFQPLEKALRNNIQPLASFDLTIRGTGVFGRRSHPSVVWAGIDDNEKLMGLQKRATEAVHKAGIAYDDKPFRPHLTLGRFKSLKNLEPLFQTLEKESNSHFQTLEVQSIEVVKSELKPGGAVYSVLSEIPLSKG